MAERFPDDCPVIRRGTLAVGFSPSPDGKALYAWWRDNSDDHHDSEIIGAFTSYDGAVKAAIFALDGIEPSDDELRVESRALERDFVATDWMGLGF